MTSVRYTAGDYVSDATVPTWTAAWCIDLWLKCNAGEYGGSGEGVVFALGSAASVEGILIDVGHGDNTSIKVIGFRAGGSEIVEATIATGSDTDWINVSIGYSGSGSAYLIRWRKENVTTWFTTNLTMSAVLNPSGASFWLGSDMFGQHCKDSSTRAFFCQANTISDALLLTASQNIDTAPAGTNLHCVRLLNAATATANTGSGGTWTATGTLQDAATEPTESSGGTDTPMTITATQSQTPTRARGLGLIRSATQTQTSSAGPAIAGGFSFSANQTQTPTRARVLGAAKSATETQTSTRSRAVAPVAKAATNAQTPSLTKGQGYLKTLAATITQTASLVRALGLIRSATQTQTLARAVAIARALSAIETQSRTIARAIATGRTVTGTQLASLTKATNRLLTLSITATQTASRSRALARALSANATQTLSSVRALARALNVTNSQTPTALVVPSGGGAINYPVAISTTINQTIALARACARPIAALQSQSITRARALTLLAKSATQLQTASRGRALAVAKSTNQLQTPSVVKGRGFFVTLAAVAIQVATFVKSVGLTRFATQTHVLDIQSEVAGGGFPILEPAAPEYCARGLDLRSAVYTTRGSDLRT